MQAASRMTFSPAHFGRQKIEPGRKFDPERFEAAKIPQLQISEHEELKKGYKSYKVKMSKSDDCSF